MNQARDDLKQIVDRLNAGGELSSLNRPGNQDDDDQNKVPSHLNDLAPDELPESQRVSILSEIDLFRERTVKKAAERAAQDEARKAQAVAQQSSASNNNNRSWGQRAGSSSSATPLASNNAASDPQSYNKPVGFVPSGAGDARSPSRERGASTAAPEVDDATKERERAEKAAREAEYMFRDVSAGNRVGRQLAVIDAYSRWRYTARTSFRRQGARSYCHL